MFGWFKKGPQLNDPQVAAVAQKWLSPSALAVALAESVHDYAAATRSGQVEYPAHKRRNDSVVNIWSDLRLEALGQMFNFGLADPMLLAQQRRQLELVRSFLDDRPYLEMPQPKGEIIADTIQAVWQVYVYLSKVGSEVADRETDRYALRLAKRDILDTINRQAASLRAGWEAFECAIMNEKADLPEMPKTLLEEIYKDVTAKTKSIALSAQFGPNYETNMKFLEDEVAKHGGSAEDVKNVRATAQRVIRAVDPDEFS